MKRKWGRVFAVWFLGVFFLLGGCATTDPVAVDLVNYVNQGVLSIAGLERSALESYAAVTGKNYTTEQKVYVALRDKVIPEYERFYDRLRDIRPTTKEVAELQRIYVRGADYLLNGFRAKMLGIEKKDPILIQAANQQIQKGRVENEKWREKLYALYKEHGVKEKEEKEKKSDQ